MSKTQPRAKHVILVIDDDNPVRMAVVEKLRLSGFTMLEATDGAAGLRLALEHHPDLILLDIIMPKVDGLGVLQQLRQDAWGKSAAVIMLTNVSGADKIVEAAKFGASDYMVKNYWSLEQVLQKVQEKLGMK